MSKHQQIRLKSRRQPRFFREGERLSRADAIAQVCALLAESPLQPEALRLMGLFRMDAEELAEAGVAYEVLRALEKHAQFF